MPDKDPIGHREAGCGIDAAFEELLADGQGLVTTVPDSHLIITGNVKQDEGAGGKEGER